jgi:thioredoxin-related protein
MFVVSKSDCLVTWLHKYFFPSTKLPNSERILYIVITKTRLMKIKSSILFFLLFAHISYSINFTNYTFKESLSKAQQDNKKVFVFFSADYSEQSNLMKSSVFIDSTVDSLVSRLMVPVMVEYNSTSYTHWVEKFEVKCLPTFIVLDTNGDVVSRYEGGMSTEGMISFIKNEKWEGQDKFAQSITFDPPISEGKTKVKKEASKLSTKEGKMSMASKKLNHQTTKTDTSVLTLERSTSNSEIGEYVVQFGAFSTLDKSKKHQKFLQDKIKEKTVIVEELSNDVVFYKLVSKTRFTQQQVEKIVVTMKGKGLACFPKMISE